MMAGWPRYPAIYEINTWVWLSELAARVGSPVTLDSVPAREWDRIAGLGFDAVWLMGVWERSPAGIAVSNQNHSVIAEFRRALPDYRPEDHVGSPFCVRRYVVDATLGGDAGLAQARAALAARGLRLLLDFVPNHVALDHPWLREHPEYFIHGTTEDLRLEPWSFIEAEHAVYACGRDPYFPAWPDVVQLNAFASALRRAARVTLLNIANQCDGVRCDMAMLVTNAVFERTWGSRAGPVPETEYWHDVIVAVRQSYPDFLFVAEVYWDLESKLQQQGFDFCFDKRLYDRLEHGTAESVRLHLAANGARQDKLLRFIETHDESRAAATFTAARARAAAVVVATLPGGRLFHEGQLEGRTVRMPVSLGRRPVEPPDRSTQRFYDVLLAVIRRPVFRDGRWRACTCAGWGRDDRCGNLVAWTWERGDEQVLVAVNLSDTPAQARVQMAFTGTAKPDVWIALPGWGYQLLAWDDAHQSADPRHGAASRPTRLAS